MMGEHVARTDLDSKIFEKYKYFGCIANYEKVYAYQDKSQNQGIHHIYIFPRFLRETASEIRRRACPSTARGKEGAAPTPTTTP